MTELQMSFPVSPSTKEDLERYTRTTGTKKSFVVERALQHHLRALRELPTDVIVHPRLVVTEKSVRQIAERLANPQPTQALRELMAERGD